MGQNDLKRLIAYTSVAHFGFIALGIFAFTTQAQTGAVLYMVNHGLSTGALFLVVGFLVARGGSRRVDDYRGIATRRAAARRRVPRRRAVLAGAAGAVDLRQRVPRPGRHLHQRYRVAAVVATVGHHPRGALHPAGLPAHDAGAAADEAHRRMRDLHGPRGPRRRAAPRPDAGARLLPEAAARRHHAGRRRDHAGRRRHRPGPGPTVAAPRTGSRPCPPTSRPRRSSTRPSADPDRARRRRARGPRRGVRARAVAPRGAGRRRGRRPARRPRRRRRCSPATDRLVAEGALAVDGPALFLQGTLCVLGIVGVLLLSERCLDSSGGDIVSQAANLPGSRDDVRAARGPAHPDRGLPAGDVRPRRHDDLPGREQPASSCSSRSRCCRCRST